MFAHNGKIGLYLPSYLMLNFKMQEDSDLYQTTERNKFTFDDVFFMMLPLTARNIKSLYAINLLMQHDIFY